MASRDVTSVDIQEYSRVICDAQLNPAQMSAFELSKVPTEVAESGALHTLGFCLEALMELEQEAALSALSGKPTDMVALIEAPPLLFSTSESGRGKLAQARKLARARLIEHNLWNSADSTITRYFGGVYFSYRQAAYLDAALLNAAQRSGKDRNTLLAAALSTASTMVNTVGKQFAQPIRPRDKSGNIKLSIISSAIKDRRIDVNSVHSKWMGDYATIKATDRPHEAIQGDYLEVLSSRGKDFSVLYADPPYTRDHYSRFYHVLETMCLRDEPAITISTRNGQSEPSRGVYRESRHQSPFCIRSTAPAAFDVLFKQARLLSIPLVLSYSPSEQGDGTHPRVLSATNVINLAQNHYRSVEVKYLHGKSHNKHNRSSLELAKRSHAEMLIICRL